MKRRDMKYVVSALQAAKPMLEISVSDLDKDGFLLNTPDGTYYLPDGLEGKRDHSPEDYITKITGSVQAHPFLQLRSNNKPFALRLGKLRLHVPFAPDRECMDAYLAYMSAQAYKAFVMKRRDMKYVVSALQAGLHPTVRVSADIFPL